MDSTAEMRKAIADRKVNQVDSLKRLDIAVQDAKTNRQKRREEQRRTE